MMDEQQRATIAQALSNNSYSVDNRASHLRVLEMERCRQCAERPCVSACPAAVYEWVDNRLLIHYSGCLECAACRFICPYDNIEWSYPRGGCGVTLTQG